jgi:SAM-dependent methyltransferase
MEPYRRAERRGRNPVTQSAYDQVADEYYDDRHQTSRNFDETTVVALSTLMVAIPAGLVLEVGCGRGRSGEFLGVPGDRVVQLDNSAKMLSLQPREPALQRVRHEAELLPFPNEDFAAVIGFLCDPFLGLNFLSEAFRILRPGGLLIGTTPAYTWGRTLRDTLNLDSMATRFALLDGRTVEVPSAIYPEVQLRKMLRTAGFREDRTSLSTHRLPRTVRSVSPDILGPARSLAISEFDLDILCMFVAEH